MTEKCKQHKPYGAWPSIVSSQQLTSLSTRISEARIEADNCYWLEQRPEEAGRCVLVKQNLQTQIKQDITPPEMSIRSKAHEYGGGSYTVAQGYVYFVNASDQRIYTHPIDSSAPATALSPENSTSCKYHYADLWFDHTRQQLICVCEIHRYNEENNTTNIESCITSIQKDGSSTAGLSILAFGNDFYSNPSVSPCGNKLTWLTWNHPNMPWDNNECWIADFKQGGMLHKQRKVAGSMISDGTANQGESIFQPLWSPTGELYFVSDRNNWWNIYSYNTYNKYSEAVIDMQAEFATPQWVFGMSTYGFLNSYTLFCTYTQQGTWHLATIDLLAKKLTPIQSHFTAIESIHCQDESDSAVFIASSPTTQASVFYWQNQKLQTVNAPPASLPETHIAQGEAINFINDIEQTVHGFFYPPTHQQYTGVAQEKPPLIALCHGGPTGASGNGLNLKIQYWTNRGFAVFDCNYSGSTGFGRHYRHQLYQQWGVRDVTDICTGVQHLIKQGKVDPKRVIIRGSSAGGYSVLRALLSSTLFKAGTSLYGISDLSALAKDTHRFEAHYCDQLIGSYPQEKEKYQQLSPIEHIDKFHCPLLFLQGMEDKVVPPNQAQTMVDALKSQGVPVAYITFDNEGHGFRQAKNIQIAIDSEYAFYTQVFNLDVKEDLPAVEVYGR